MFEKIKKQVVWLGIFILMAGGYVHAAVPDVFLYEGRLLTPAGVPILVDHEFRFSLWSSSDFVAGDVDGVGAINAGAVTFSGWTEEHTVTPNPDGTFSLQLGSVVALPDMNFAEHKYLQVEVKLAGDPDTDYQLMDIDGDNGANATDRKVMASVPYALNAKNAEQALDDFTLDADDTVFNAGTGSVKLEFGDLLNKYLEYDLDNGYFNFNDDVNIDGDLTVTGLINGVDVTALAGGHAQDTDTGTDSDTFEVNNDGNGLVFDTAGLTADIDVTFDDADTVVVGEDNVQTLTNKTIDGDNNTLVNIDFSSLKERNKSALIIPEFDGMIIDEDGSNNQATLREGYDQAENYQYFKLTSREAGLQDLDVYVQWQVPDDFVSWQASPVELNFKTTTANAAENQADFTMFDTANNLIALVGASDLVSAVGDTWLTQTVTFGGVPVFTPGEHVVLRFNLQAQGDNAFYLSEIKLNYVGR